MKISLFVEGPSDEVTLRVLVQKILGKQIPIISRVDISPSKALDCKPKKIMKKVFRQNGKGFLNTRDNPRIAKRIDIDKIVKNNKSFEHFRDRIKDP